MRVTETHVLTTLYSARAFIDRHAAQLGTVETAGYRTELDAVIETLEENAAGQGAARRGAVGQLARQNALCSALRLNHMTQIATIAAAQRQSLPELDALQMPSSHTTPRRLVADADAMAQVARQHPDVFIAAGLPTDFVEQLEAAAQALAEIITTRGTLRAQRSGSTAALRTAASRGRKVLAVLSAMIQPQLADNPALLAEWKTARHILRPPRAEPIDYALLYGLPKPMATTPAVSIATAVQPAAQVAQTVVTAAQPAATPVQLIVTPAQPPVTPVPPANVTVDAAAPAALEPADAAPDQPAPQSAPLGGVIGRVMRAFGGQTGAGVH